MTIVNLIGEAVRQREWNIQTFADKTGIAYNTAYDLYNGRARRIGLEVLDKVCKVLNLEPGDLLKRVEDGPSPTASSASISSL